MKYSFSKLWKCGPKNQQEHAEAGDKVSKDVSTTQKLLATQVAHHL